MGEAYDDGYTGTNYNRPGFCAVMDRYLSLAADQATSIDSVIILYSGQFVNRKRDGAFSHIHFKLEI